MPTSIFINGQRQYRPSVYARVINNLTAQNEPATGNLAIVGDFPQLKQATPVRFTNSLDLADYMRDTNLELATISPLVFNPLDTDSTINSLTLVSANESTQASTTNGGLKVKSRLWGTDGVRLKVRIASNASDATLFDVEVIEGIVTRESVTGLGESNIASLAYTSAPANESFTRMTSTIDADNFLVNAGADYLELAVQAGGDLFEGTSIANGNLTLTVKADQSAESTFTISGLNLAGIATSEVITVPATALTDETFVTANAYSRVDSIDGTSSGSFEGNLEVDFNLFSKSLDAITSFEDTLNEVKALDDDLSGTFTVSTPALTVKGTDLDAVTGSIMGATLNFTNDLITLADWFNGSAFVEAEKVSNTAITTSANATRLLGGTSDTVVSSSDWQSAFDAIKRLDINIVVPFNNDLEIMKLASQHAIDSANDAGYERNVWAGTPSNQTITQAFSGYAKELNDRNVAITLQSIIVNGVTLDPRYTACLLAGMQGATSISEPLTRKKPNASVTGTVENFKREEEASLAIRKGLVFFADPQNTGLRVERSVTTWLKDDNPVYSEVSANESMNQSIRLLREALQAQIGTKVTSARRSAVQKVAESALSEQKKNGIIKNFTDLIVTLDGDLCKVTYSLATVEPLNFITVTANIVR